MAKLTCAAIASLDGGAAARAAAADQRAFDDLFELGLGEGALTARALGAVARHLLRWQVANA